ncbi:MAG: valine--tRNA ligase [Acidobacteria bacterium RIFCSPLOWO2_12_FULL_60_22]|nr:MAG: valine--tRNA ligase [Acidobacteria bacterium RIFCSPLOWO2_12_FULL_60_22]
MAEIAKQYNPSEIEPRWAREWVEKRLYGADAASTKPMFSLVIPPPNVTGSLHMGHMLEHTEIDIIIRWKRMQGFNTLWLPGTDHAGIATQMVVERQLAEQKLDRRTLGREAFEKKVWEWKAQSGDTIKRQMVRLGASCDWSRERFTLDPGLSRAVREVFVRLYEKKLIYRGKYIVNWCPRCQTAISDLEVVHEEHLGNLFHIRYPVLGAEESGQAGRPVPTGEHVVVATTRPETMLGDTAVAVNPADERYKKFHGKTARLPLMNRDIPFILDELADPAFGTGVVKVTPAHDANDFLAGERHHLPQIDVMDETGKMNSNAGAYAGLDRFAARKRVLADLEEQGLLEKIEPYTHALGRCQRCRTVVEPRLSTQWFVKVKPLAEAAIRAVEDGRTRFTPENYTKIYFDWLTNIHDWCISRQLWWGHRVPAWHCGACNEVVVAREEPAQCPHCRAGNLKQDPDVLDTWFSSALWPFSTLGWPDATEDLRVFYPTSLMITGFDILFFWVARMMMMGIEFMREIKPGDNVPFRVVYIHQLVRDAEKQKMSKTRGNVIDPLVVTEKFGTDAVRFTLAIMAAPGTDIALSEDRMEGYRAFANKIWNASRFLFLSLEKAGITSWTPPADGNFQPVAGPDGTLLLEDRWIFSRLSCIAGEMAAAWDAFRFHEAAHLIYHFFWHEFCDWYLELKKLGFEAVNDKSEDLRPVGIRVAFENLCRAFDIALRLLHPMMPFITEELWQRLGARAGSIALAAYPAHEPNLVDEDAERQMDRLQQIIVNLRNMRAEMRVDAKRKIPAELYAPDDGVARLSLDYRAAIERLASLSALTLASAPLTNEGGVVRSLPDCALKIELKDAVDLDAERARLRKEEEKLLGELRSVDAQLQNEQFLSKAPAKVVDSLRQRKAELAEKCSRMTESLQKLG